MYSYILNLVIWGIFKAAISSNAIINVTMYVQLHSKSILFFISEYFRGLC